jgi:TolB protein
MARRIKCLHEPESNPFATTPRANPAHPPCYVRTVKAIGLLLAAATLWAQPDIRLTLTGSATIAIAVPDFRGAGNAQPLMAAFNETLWDDLDNSGLVKLMPKTSYPKSIPQQPQELRTLEWANPPVSATYIAMGYTAEVNGQLVLYGWLVDLRQSSAAAGTVLAAHYNSSSDQAGARKTAHEFAADIIRKFGGKPLTGTQIYFTSDRNGEQNVWAMDADGSNQHQVTHLSSKNGRAAMTPAISLDATLLALTSYAEFYPKIFLFSLGAAPRRMPFHLPGYDLQTTPSFTPDGKQMLFAWKNQIYISDLDGGHPHRISGGAAESEPKVNPKTGAELAFVSGRGGHARIYKMSLDGTDVTPLTSAAGEANNPAWNPNGQMLAYAGTKGIATAGYHICLMDVATQAIIELPNNGSRDENPSWAPDGVHLVFMSQQGRQPPQIWTVLADGTHRRQLTTTGANKTPVWTAGN